MSRSEDEAFFSEWQTQLPELSHAERSALDELYGLSRAFAPFTSDRETYSALQTLKRIGRVIGEGAE